MATEVKFYVIYSADWGPEDYNGHTNHELYFRPWKDDESDKDLWYCTEDGESEWDELGLTEHRKWVTVDPITREQFDAFIHQTCLQAQDVQTLGSLTDRGWMPAVSFDGSTSSEIVDAYVTPLVESKTLGDDDWDRLYNAVVSVYGR